MRSLIYKKSNNVHLRGKKSKALACGCCDAYNFTEDELLKEHMKEISYYIGISSNGRTADSDSVNRGSNPCIPANEEDYGHN